MKKSDCTPEQWEKYLAVARASYQRNRMERLEKCKAYNKTEKAKARRKEYDRRPDVTARRHERNRSEETKGKRKARWQQVKSDPALHADHKARLRKHRTGMDAVTFDALMSVQNAKCAICATDISAGNAKADHCHDSQQPRGLLCHHCNVIEGMIKGRGLTPSEFCDRLHSYLSNPPFISVVS